MKTRRLSVRHVTETSDFSAGTKMNALGQVAVCGGLLAKAPASFLEDHPAQQQQLLEQVDELLSGRSAASAEERIELANKLERARYRYVNEHGLPVLEQEASFLQCVDLAANTLAGRKPRPPRETHTATQRSAMPVLLKGRDLPPPALAVETAEQTNRRFAAQVPGTESAPFLRRMLLYAPLYVSNYCVNHCTYCGFRYPLDIPRQHLSIAEALDEARVLYERDFRHILVVAGDFPSLTTNDYFCQLIEELVQMGFQPAVEIAPKSTQDYARLVDAGTVGVTLYQETYDERLYGKYHPRGPKSSYLWRLEGLDRAAEAGVKRLGLGTLLGLAPPEEELDALVRHGKYLAERHPDCQLAFSLPRIHEAPADFHLPFTITDEQLIRFYCLLRLEFPTAEMVLSTRETAELRNRLATICITQLSAGSCTSPGGYQEKLEHAGKQFPVADERTPAEVAAWLRTQQLQPIWSIA
jgi:2-iminoacetate synthase